MAVDSKGDPVGVRQEGGRPLCCEFDVLTRGEHATFADASDIGTREEVVAVEMHMRARACYEPRARSHSCIRKEARSC